MNQGGGKQKAKQNKTLKTLKTVHDFQLRSFLNTFLQDQRNLSYDMSRLKKFYLPATNSLLAAFQTESPFLPIWIFTNGVFEMYLH